MSKSSYYVYFGSYADKQSPGIYVYQFNEDTEQLEFVEFVSGLKNPSYLHISDKQSMLYTFSQGEGEQEMSEATAYRIDPKTGKLTYAGQQLTADKASTHINTDAAESYLMLVSYAGGIVSLLPLEEDGTIGGLTERITHEGGSGVVPQRQDTPHPHSIYTDPSDRFVLVPDLGKDAIVVYRLDRDKGKLLPHDEVRLAPGSGPRHMAFHPALDYAYVIQELSSTVTVLSYDRSGGKFEPIQMVNTLPEKYDGPENLTAEVQISPDGLFLYGSNRGHDSIAVFSIDPESGMLTAVEEVSTLGKHPRHFGLTPSGRYVFAANKDSDEVQLFRVDPQTGRLAATGRFAAVSQPTCVRFFPSR